MTGSEAALAFWIVWGLIFGGYGIWQTFFDEGGGSGFGGGDGSSGTSI